MKFSIGNIARKKTIIIVCLVLIIFRSATSLVSYYYSSKTIYDNIYQSFENRVADDSKMLSQIFKERLTDLKLLAEDDDIRSMNWETQKSELLKYVKTLDVSRFRITYPDGLSNSTDGYIKDMSDRVYFQKALRGIPNISDLLRSKVDNSLVICCAVPVMDDSNHVICVLSYTEDYKVLSNLISDIKVGKNGYAILINMDGLIVAHPEKERKMMGETIFEQAKRDPGLKGAAALISKMIKEKTGSTFYNYMGTDKFAAYTPVPGTDWILGLTIPKNEVFTQISSLRQKFIIGTAVFVIIAILLAYITMIYMSQKKKVAILQKDANENHEQMKEMAELDRLKTEFMANVSHELRTPLTVILTAIQLLELYFKGDLNNNIDKMKKHLVSMHKNGLRLLRLINNLIDITKIDAGVNDLNLKCIDIVSLIEDTTLSVVEYANNKDLTIEFHSEIKEKKLYCDPDKIERILLNLISNAIKFTKPGGHILIKVSEKNGILNISVKDTGIGIPEDKQHVIFERFRQVDQSLTRNYEGSGIGLSLTKSLVEMHRGKISLVSEIDKGSEFIVELPEVIDANKEQSWEIDYNFDKSNTSHDRVKIELSDISI